MKAALTTIGVTALAILAGWILIRIAEHIETRMAAKKAADAAADAPAAAKADPVGIHD
jgi:hypothetical protein